MYFTYNAPVAAHIPSDLQDKLNKTNGLFQFRLKPMVTPSFVSCLKDCRLDLFLADSEEEYSDEYNTYRRQLGVVFNHPVVIQGYLNNLATGWKGDSYALVQRQKALAQTI